MIMDELIHELDVAEQKAWDALSRYKFQMFGYWAAIWVHLNRLSKARRSNPWIELVKHAKKEKEQIADLAKDLEEAGDLCPRCQIKSVDDGCCFQCMRPPSFYNETEKPA